MYLYLIYIYIQNHECILFTNTKTNVYTYRYPFCGAGLQHNMLIEMPSLEVGEIQHDCRLAFPVEYEVPAHVWIRIFQGCNVYSL